MSLLRNAALTMCILGAGLVAADNPFVGTWKLNADKSKLEGSNIGPGSTVRIEAESNGLKITVESTDAKGQPVNFNYVATLDGKPVDITGYQGVNTVTTLRTTRKDDHTIEATATREGKQVFKDHRVVSADGKTMTIHRTGVNQDGKHYTATLVFDKQE